MLACRPDVIHVSSPGLLVFSGILYAKLLDLPLVVSYHTHIPGKLVVLLHALSSSVLPVVTACFDLRLSTHTGRVVQAAAVHWIEDMLVTIV